MTCSHTSGQEAAARQDPLAAERCDDVALRAVGQNQGHHDANKRAVVKRFLTCIVSLADREHTDERDHEGDHRQGKACRDEGLRDADDEGSSRDKVRSLGEAATLLNPKAC